MRFLMMIKGNPDYEAGKPPSPALMEGMGRLAEEMTRAGVLLASEGLAPSSQGARVRLVAGKRSVIDGPFAEAKEVVGGFAIVEARSRAEAVDLAHKVVDVHLDAGIRDFEMEIRPLYGPGQCGDAQAAAAEAACAS
ncbi:MAG: hypothetical protein IT518_29380 [Burkholderiales bacterium]|nr:hypothetical protein [Burkholderiales bacterium]